jgi:hypothetical protein
MARSSGNDRHTDNPREIEGSPGGYDIGSRELAARRPAAIASWVLAAIAPVVGAIWFVVHVADLDPNDEFYGMAIAVSILVIGGVTLTSTLLFVGLGLFLSQASEAGRNAYLFVVALASLWGALVALPALDVEGGFVLLLAAAGAFFLMWRGATVSWQRYAALIGSLLCVILAVGSVLPAAL